MERIERPEALAALVRAQLQRGVFTNQPLTADWAAWVAEGAAAEPFDGGLWIARRRGDHDLLTFCLQAGAAAAKPRLERPAVTEIAFREKDAAAARSAAGRLEAAGFREVLRRARRSRPAEPPAGAGEACRFPGPAEAAAVEAFLAAHFDGLTGCLPPPEALAAALAGRQVVTLEDGRGIAGLLHYAPGRGSWEIRHLAVRADLRGHGLAGRLLDACLRENGGQRSTVWARQGNAPAERFYEKHGYRPDGWQSIVLAAGERTNHASENH